MWLLFPGCDVQVVIDNGAPIKIGYSSPKAALDSYLDSAQQIQARSEVEVREFTEAGINLAFAVRRNSRFKDWSFLTPPADPRNVDRSAPPAPMGVCVEGVCVEFNTPGFGGHPILAVVNATGKNAPKTNVARSALEETSEQRNMLETIYNLYARHVSGEITRLMREEQFFLSKAVAEAPYIAAPLMAHNVQKPAMMKESYAKIPLIIAEDKEHRSNISFEQIKDVGEFWTVASPLSRSIETFIKEAPSDIQAGTLIKTLGNSSASYPVGLTVCNFSTSHHVSELIRSDFEISEVVASESLRRIDIKWKRKETAPRWSSSASIWSRAQSQDPRFIHLLMNPNRQRRGRGARLPERIHFPVGKVEIAGLDQEGGFFSERDRYLRSGTALSSFLEKKWSAAEADGFKALSSYLVILDEAVFHLSTSVSFSEELMRRFVDDDTMSLMREHLGDMAEFILAVQQTERVFFDPYAWDRRPMNEEAAMMDYDYE